MGGGAAGESDRSTFECITDLQAVVQRLRDEIELVKKQAEDEKAASSGTQQVSRFAAPTCSLTPALTSQAALDQLQSQLTELTRNGDDSSVQWAKERHVSVSMYHQRRS